MTEVLQTPIKSPNDKNLYRLIKLENGLKVLLIQHESEEKQAALVLSIDVGGFDDPKEAKGLTHFLEHMVFMGSEKYPKENEFHEFVSSHGGNLNAMTGYNSTTFYFMIGEDAFEGAIDRFSSIFVSPLMLEHAIEREVDSVEAEFKLRINNDFVRQAQLYYEYVIDDHPAKVFIPGNIKTLKENRSHSELYQLVHDHHQKFYVANRMTLAVESSKNLDDLQKTVENYFSGIQSGIARGEVPEINFKNIFKPQFFEKVIYMKPKTDMRYLCLFWPLPSESDHYKIKPLNYLKNLITTESKGGLASYLKKRLLIKSLGVDCCDVFGGKIVSLFEIYVSLSEYGSKRVGEILEAIYSYLLLIKETPMEKHREIFENLQNISSLDFRFREDQTSNTNTREAAKGMHAYEDIDVIRGKHLMLEYNEEVLLKYIDLINEPNFGTMILDHEAEVEFDKIENYFGTEFCEADIPEDYQIKWNERQIIEELSLPPKNEFVCTNFDIFAENEEIEKMVRKLNEKFDITTDNFLSTDYIN